MVVKVFHYVARFDKMVEETSVVVREGKGEGDGGGGGGGGGEEGGGSIYFEEGGLEAGFYDVKRACDDGSAHSA